MGYNPADYKAVQSDAVAMPKKELEEYYVKGKNDEYHNCCQTIGLFLFALFAVFAIGFLGYAIASDIIKDQVQDSTIQISDEVCPYIGEAYESQDILKKSLGHQNSIICNQYNSGFEKEAVKNYELPKIK